VCDVYVPHPPLASRPNADDDVGDNCNDRKLVGVNASMILADDSNGPPDSEISADAHITKHTNTLRKHAGGTNASNAMT
jgi:hypothetical protein